MSFRVSFRFKQPSTRDAGWSENFWYNSSALSDTKLAAERLRQCLNAITGDQVQSTGFRISDATVFRRVSTSPRPAPNVIDPALTFDADYPTNSLQWQFTGSLGGTVTQWHSGIPDKVISHSGFYFPSGLASYNDRMNAFFAELSLTSNAWSLNGLLASSLPKPITDVNLTTGVLTAPGHGFPASPAVYFIRIKGFAGFPYINKIWRGVTLTADTVQLSFWQVQTPTPVLGGKNPTARWQNYGYDKIVSGVVIGSTSHKRGRPQGQLSGRRRTRKR
jgi:hypothetical protein